MKICKNACNLLNQQKLSERGLSIGKPQLTDPTLAWRFISIFSRPSELRLQLLGADLLKKMVNKRGINAQISEELTWIQCVNPFL